MLNCASVSPLSMQKRKTVGELEGSEEAAQAAFRVCSVLCLTALPNGVATYWE